MPRAPPSQSALRQLYFPVCSAGLVYCLSRQYKLTDDGTHPNRLAAAVAQECSRVLAWVRATCSSGLLQTQLGVALFSTVVLLCCAMTGAAATALFLGPLNASEAGRLVQRLLRYLLAQAVLAGSLGLSKQLPLLIWMPWLAGIGQLKMFVGLCKDRAAGLSVAPAVTLQRYVHTLALLLLVLAADGVGWLLLLWQYQQRTMSWRMCLLFGLDLAVTAVDAAKATLSCTALLLDEALAANPQGLQPPAHSAVTDAAPPSTAAAVGSRIMLAWQQWQGHGREAFFYQADLKADLAVHALTIAHHMHVWVLHGLSCQLFDALLLLDARNVLLSALKKMRQHKAQMAATSSLDAAFPDVITGHVASTGCCASDNSADTDSEAAECVICRERMASAKQLPCGHLFHLQCLRAWLQQSSTSSSFSCPMCRQPLLLPAAAARQTLSQQQQQLLHGVSNTRSSSGFDRVRVGPSSGVASGGFASGHSVRPSLMSSLSFGLMSPDELQPSAAAAAAAAQHEARLEQLQDRGDSWDRDDALMQQQLDSPGTEASFDDVALQEALVASLQFDSRARDHASHSSSRSGSRVNSPSSHSSSCSHGYIVSPAAGACGAVVLPPPAFPGVTAAAAAGVPASSSHSSFLPLQQCSVSNSSAGSSSWSAYGSATSSCAASPALQRQQQQQCEAGETFYACSFSDPLGESDVVPEAAVQPSTLNMAASSVGRTCSRVLTSLISRSPSPCSNSSNSTGCSSSALAPSFPAAPLCAGSGSSMQHDSAHAGIILSAADAGCSSGSKHRHKCDHQHHQHVSEQQQQQQAFTPTPSGSRCSICHKRCHRYHSSSSGSLQDVCECSSTAAAAAAATAQQQCVAVEPGSSAKRVLLSKYAALKLDVGHSGDISQQHSATASTAGTPCDSSAAFLSPVAAVLSPSAATKLAAEAADCQAGAATDAEDVAGSPEATSAAAAAAVAQLIASPRDPCRRREDGRWGRRRMLGATSPAAAAAASPAHGQVSPISPAPAVW